MLVIFSLIAAMAGLTGASSLARCLSKATRQPQGISRYSTKEQDQGVPPAGKAVAHAHSSPLPASLYGQASLVANLLDDVEIQLRVLARQQPGPERRCTASLLSMSVSCFALHAACAAHICALLAANVLGVVLPLTTAPCPL